MSDEFIKRREPTIEVGLTASEVEERVQAGFVNRKFSIKHKKTTSVIIGNFLSVHYFLVLLILGLVVASNYWMGLFFLIPVAIDLLFKILIVSNSLYRNKTKSQLNYFIVRDGVEKKLPWSSIVLDDIISLKEKDYIPVDGTIKHGELIVDESSLLGLSNPQIKKTGDKVYFGTVVLSGNGFVICEKMDNDTIRGKQLVSKKGSLNKFNLASLVASIIISVCTVFVMVAYFVLLGQKGGFASYEAFKETGKTVGFLCLTVTPFGMFAMISLTIFMSHTRTKKLNARVQNLVSLETLTHVDTLCFDKTGVLTSNDFEVKKVLLYGTGYTNDDVEQIVSNLLETNKDNDLIAQALHRSFNYSLTKGIVSSLPYSDTNKYAGATFTGGETYAIGYPAFLNILNRSALNHRTEEYIKQGCDVVVLARCKNAVKNGTIEGEMVPIALIILQKRLRRNLSSVISALKAEGKNIKIISGDDPQIVVQTAAECGVDDSYRFVSLKDMSKEEVERVALEYDVFGFASAEQKQIIIETLQKHKKTVAMIGDGDNDILAFRVCDVAICSEGNSKTAGTCADILLKDGDLTTLPKLFEEGKKATYNIQRIAALFLTRSMFGFILALTFFITSLTINQPFPFKPEHFYLIGVVITSLGGLLICFDNPKRPIVGPTVRNILRKAIPGAIVLSLVIVVYFSLMLLQQNLIFYTGIYSYETVMTLSIITFSILGIAILFKCYTRFELYSLISFFVVILVFVAVTVPAVILSFKLGVDKALLGIDFSSLTLVNYFVFGLVIIIITSLYLIISYIIEVLKGEHLHVKNKS